MTNRPESGFSSQPTPPNPVPPPGSPPPAKDPARAEEPHPKKSLWDTTITSTPVIMTVIATLLAGMSASEMTWAQYFRATAAQNQSKVADQFNFFQAKKIRGTSMELTTTLLRALSEPDVLDADAVRKSADLLARELARADQEAHRLETSVKNLNRTASASGDKADSTIAQLQKEIARIVEKIDRASKTAAELQKTTDDTLANGTEVEVGRGTDKRKERVTREELDRAFGYLIKGLPAVQDKTVAEAIEPPSVAEDIKKAIEMVKERKPEEETRALMRRIPEKALKDAYHLAVQNATNFDRATDELRKSFGVISRMVSKQLELARGFHRTVQELTRVFPDARPDESQQMKEARASLAALSSTDRAAKDSVEQLFRDFRAASLDFDVRRYDAEGRYNLDGALLYELQVRKSNFESDRHMDRKTMLFYAMLGAQAGVTIATLALAVRRKSAIWGLAAMAGAAAVAFGGYVSVTM